MTFLSKARLPFYDAWESLPANDRDREIRRRLTEYLNFAKERSPFYKDRLNSYSENSEFPLEKVPFLVAQNLRDNLPPKASTLITDLTKSFSVFQSGGTTGMPKTSLFTAEEMSGVVAGNVRGFHAVGLNEKDRVANLWAVGGLYMTFIHMNSALENYGCMSFPFSNATPVDFVHTVAKLFDINVFTGISSVVLNSLREMERKERGSLRVKKVFYGGEHIYEADKKELLEKMGVEVIKAPGYGTVDSWYIGYQCSQTPTGVFHAFDDQVYIEILDENDYQPVATGESGMLFVTAFPRRLTPVIRYQVGDRARWLKTPCSCGRTTPLFQLLGRGDDVLRIAYDSLDYGALQGVASRIPGLSGMIQMEKRRLEGRDKLIIRVESEAGATEIDALKHKFHDELLLDRPPLRDFVKKQSIWPIEIEILAPGSLPLNPRTGKLIRVIDAL